MDYQELLQKYNTLLKEINRLTQENNQLKAKLGLPESEPIPKTVSAKNTERKIPADESDQKNFFSGVDCTSNSLSKIRLFMSLFKGREDVYAKRWENKSKRKSGYAPLCLNEWQPGICGKPKISCSKCNKHADPGGQSQPAIAMEGEIVGISRSQRKLTGGTDRRCQEKGS